MALDYDNINSITRQVMLPVLLDNIFNGSLVLSRAGGRVSVREDPNRPWREMFAEIEKMEREGK